MTALSRRGLPIMMPTRPILRRHRARPGSLVRSIGCKGNAMHYVVHCLDHDGAVETRLANYDAHKAYLAAAPVKTVISGPLLADDEQTMIGSCFVIEADSLAEVEDFNRNDPFAKVGLWKSVSVRPFLKRVDNR